MDTNRFRNEILKDPLLSKLSNLSKEMDVPFFLVGGYIRDLILKSDQPGYCLEGKDYDFILPKDQSSFLLKIEKTLLYHFFRVGKEQRETLTYRIIKEDMSIDLTFLQGKTIEEDLRKRDFTINTIAFSFQNETFHWVEGAPKDIEKKIIRSVSDRSIDQDPLRMLRAIRYGCTLDGFTLNNELENEISIKKEKICRIPGERIKAEMDQILLSPRPFTGIRLLYYYNLLFTLFPELKGLNALGQNEHHHLDVISHILLMVEKTFWAFDWVARNDKKLLLTQEDRLSLYYASLFHDIGKQNTYSKDEKGRVHFYDHESFSCEAAKTIMDRLRFSNRMKNKILRLIQNHMRILNLSRETKETALKRIVNQMGEETPLLVLHTLADKEASRGILSIQIDEIVEGHCLRILQLFLEKEIVHPSLFITGHDVMALGYPSGPKVGEILTLVREKQIEGEIKTREKALEFLREQFGKS